MSTKRLFYFLLIVLFQSLFYFLFLYFIYNVAFDYVSLSGDHITRFGFKNEVLILINIGLILLLITKRKYMSVVLTILIYSLFIFINLEKIKYFNNPLLPLDFKYINQFLLAWPIFKSYIPAILITVLLFFLVFYFFIKKERPIKFLQSYISLQVLLCFLFLFLITINVSGLYQSVAIKLATNEKGRAHLVATSQKFGLMTTFVRNIIHISANKKPDNYSFNKMKSIWSKYKASQTNQYENSESDVNLIIYLIESFTDPIDAGIKTTIDPIPFFHELQSKHPSGFVYSPEIGGRSANAEFEILTGFSKHFFDEASIPFIDLPYRHIPSIARELSNIGYFTKVIQGANLGYFNYKQMYSMLGFQKIISLNGKAGVPLDVAHRGPSDEAIVDEIISTSQQEDRFFIYAFPNSTHGTWRYGAYDNSNINLKPDHKLTSEEDGAKQLRTYMNALNTADKAIMKLISHFDQSESKTVILILGDHQPGMPEFREHYMKTKFPNRFNGKTRKQIKKQFFEFDESNKLESYDIMHRTPYVLWSNFNLPNQDNKTLGMNELAPAIFKALKHQPDNFFYHFLDLYTAQSKYSDLLKYTHLNGQGLSAVATKWLLDYENIQYDLLLGNEYLTKISNNNQK